MTEITEERAEDRDAVEALFDLAFAPGRSNLSSYRLRAGVAPVAALCLLARDEFDMVVGAIRFWPVKIGPPDGAETPGAEMLGAEPLDALLLGPVAVHPIRQSEGLGSRLILEGLDRAAALGWRACLLVGDEPYYGRFGFRRALAARIEFPAPTNPRRVLAKELSPAALKNASGPVRRYG